MALITFILTEKHPTTYQKNDGEYSDLPVRKRLIPEYSLMDKDGNSSLCRHVRNENSIYVKDQTIAFNKRTDNLYFSYGVMVLDEQKDKSSVEFMRKHPMNHDAPSFTRRPDVHPSFREVKQEAEGITAIDRLRLVHQASNMVMELQTKGEDGVTTYSPKLQFLAKAFNLDGSFADSEKVVELVKKASSNPSDFMHIVSSKWETMESDLETAIRLDVVSFDSKIAFVNKEAIVALTEEVDEKTMRGLIMCYLLSKEGEDKYVTMLKSSETESQKAADEAKIVKPSSSKKEAKEKETTPKA